MSLCPFKCNVCPHAAVLDVCKAYYLLFMTKNASMKINAFFQLPICVPRQRCYSCLDAPRPSPYVLQLEGLEMRLLISNQSQEVFRGADIVKYRPNFKVFSGTKPPYSCMGLASFQGLPHFYLPFVFTIIQGRIQRLKKGGARAPPGSAPDNTWEWKSSKKLGNCMVICNHR